MAQPLELLLTDGVIDEVFTRLKSGKEADIYLVRHGAEVVAAKVYKERNARNFKNNAAYMEGRRVRNTRTQRAMDRGSRFGQASAEHAWKAKESEALHKLHAAGVRVPKPVMFYEGVLLMEAVLDSDGRPAPRLIEAAIPREQAAALYADVRSQAVKMLACDLVHGDLSPYNVLLAWNGPTVIDFPQVVGAAHNSQAERFFERDIEAIRRFFAGHDPALEASAGDAREIWRAFVRRELTPDFVPTGKAPSHPPRHERRDERRHDQPRERQGQRHGQQPGQQQSQRHGQQPGQQQGQRHGQLPGQQQSQRHGQQPGQQQGPRHGQQPGQQQGPRHGQQPGQQQGPRHPQQPRQQQGPPQGQPRQGAPDRRGDQGRRGQPGPQVTVVQRLPGVAPSPAQPKREGGHGQGGGGQGHGRGRGRPHGHRRAH